jgi:hypothetical protein
MSNKVYTGQDYYKIGDIVDLMLEIDDVLVQSQGSTIPIKILDPFSNIISEVTATQLDGNLYIAEYIIPYNLSNLYNLNNSEDIDTSFYELTDKWELSNGTSFTFTFYVSKSEVEQPVLDNSLITIELSNILDINSNTIEDTIIEFVTKLSPYYGNIETVKSFKRDELGSLSNFDIARDIIEWSNYVDLHMRPNYIYFQPQYDNAVREYVNASVAKYLLIPILNVNAESKELDTFKISRQSGGAEFVIKRLDELIEQYEKIVYGGGRDTVYNTALFTKSLNDPNRPNVSRATLLVNDTFPWVNVTSNCQRIEVDGQEMEVRGVRGLTFRSIFRLPPTSITRLNETSF